MAKSNKTRIVVYLRNDLVNKINNENLGLDGNTTTAKINQLIDLGIESILDKYEVNTIDAVANKIINYNNKIISDYKDDLINVINYQSELIQALIKSTKSYAMANISNSNINREDLLNNIIEYIDNKLKDDIDLISKKYQN